MCSHVFDVTCVVCGQVFGAYCSTDWDERLNQDRNLAYFGTGETFLFLLEPRCEKYAWVGLSQPFGDVPPSANLFMAGDRHQILIGGGRSVSLHSVMLDVARCRRASFLIVTV